MDMDDSDTSSLSSVAPDEEVQKLAPIFLKAKRATKKVAPPPVASPPRPKRAPSPPHEDVFADNPDIAFIVMFRSRFSSAFSPKLAHFGPQDIERAVSEEVPTPQAEALLCALLGLVLNRKKPVEQGHHGRALEEAITSHKSQWPSKWEGRNPLSGSRSFGSMTPDERLYLLRTLIMWALTSSEDISTIIKDSYKQNRHNDDENQPLSVQPWGRDGDKRRYFLVEGQDDTSFRVYREGPRHEKNVQWYSVAGDIEEVRALAQKLETVDGTQAARTLSARMLAAIPRFEATEEKRKRREYRQQRKAQFTRPEPGFSLYEGRTRGKRMRYTFDEDDIFSDDDSVRRSSRFSDRDTPDTGPVTTLSGRQVKPRRGGEYGASLLSGQADTPMYDEGMATDDSAPRNRARSTRNDRPAYQTNGKRKLSDDDMDEGFSDEEVASEGGWDSEANGKDDYEMPDADDEEEDDEDPETFSDDELEQKSLVVKLKISPRAKHISDAEALTYRSIEEPSSSQPEPKEEPKPAPSPNAGRSTHNGLLSEHYESPSHHTAPAAQISLSGYPTPASLPPPAFKSEPQQQQEISLPAQAQPEQAAPSWRPQADLLATYMAPQPPSVQPSTFATTQHSG